PAEGRRARPAPAADWATILVVEDEPSIRQLLIDLLGSFGYHTVGAESAEKALDLLNVLAPDLIITDVHMGAISGIELCKRVKAGGRADGGVRPRSPDCRPRRRRRRLLPQAGGLRRAQDTGHGAPQGQAAVGSARACREGHYDARADDRAARRLHARSL